jgi:DNA gyrase subunit B
MAEDSYNSEQIQVISNVEGVRKRPAMYFGNTGSSGTEIFVYELVANVLDRYLAGTATFVSVEINKSKITVIDDGLGLPFDRPSEVEGISLATQLLTKLHFTGSSDGHTPHVHVSYASGMGLAVLNAASSSMCIQSWRDGVLWEQDFKQGIASTEPIIVDHPISPGKHRGIDRGTSIQITPDPEIFGAATPRLDLVRQKLFEMAHLVKGIEIRLNRERFHAPEGLVQLLPFLDSNRCDHFGNPIEYRPPFQATIQVDGIEINAVAVGSIKLDDNQRLSINPQIYAWVNGVLTAAGGSHVTGFLAALNEADWLPVIIMIHVVMFDPEFAGPTKTKLASPKIAKIVEAALLKPLQLYCNSFKPRLDS